MKKIFAILITMVLTLLVVACDQTDLYGEIVIVQNDTIDSKLLLMLEVPDELSEIYDVMWTVNRVMEEEQIMNNDLIIRGDKLLNYYSKDELKRIFETDELDFDKIALFMPTSAGKYIIEADGYYKQTNPQPITQIEVDIK